MGFLRRLLGRDDRDAMDIWADRVPSPSSTPPSGGDLILVDAGPKKIQVIKVVLEGTGLGLREAKDLVDGVPSVVNGVSREALERAGAVVEHHWHPDDPAPAPPVTTADVYLVDAGRNKIKVIKAVREATGLGLQGGQGPRRLGTGAARLRAGTRPRPPRSSASSKRRARRSARCSSYSGAGHRVHADRGCKSAGARPTADWPARVPNRRESRSCAARSPSTSATASGPSE